MNYTEPKLTAEEKRVLDFALKAEQRPSANFEVEKRKFIEVAKNTNRKKSKQISIRLKEIDLDVIKKKASDL